MTQVNYYTQSVYWLEQFISKGDITLEELPRKVQKRIMQSRSSNRSDSKPIYTSSAYRRGLKTEESGPVLIGKIENTNGDWYGPKYGLTPEHIDRMNTGDRLQIGDYIFIMTTWVDICVYK